MRAAGALPLAAAAAAAALVPEASDAAGWTLGAPGDLAAEFARFKARFGRSYASPAEEARRLAVFTDNMAWVMENQPHTHGVTKFADMTPDEFRATYLRPLEAEEEAEEGALRAVRPKWDGTGCATCKRFPEMATYADDTLDWSTKGAVTRVKNQGQCDSCYAFGATGDMEGSWFLAGNPLISMSEQELISCVGLYNGTKKGCGGGTRAKMFNWAIDNGGVTSEENYPYTSGAGVIVGTPKCKPELEKPVVAQFSSYQQISTGSADEPKLFTAVQSLGPISIGISAVRMELYVGGILDGVCNTKHDHAPLIVGYGTGSGKDYWKVKNSWGHGWGESGYFRIARGKNQCGLADDAVHTVVGGGTRYHCHLETKTCAPANKGHDSMNACEAQCNALPTPAPPATPKPPPGPPAPAGPRYHCVEETYQCVVGTKGHTTLDTCKVACYAPGYVCGTHPDGSPLCKGVATGGVKLHVCQDQCGTPAPPAPTPPPTPSPCDVVDCDMDCKCKGKNKCVVCATIPAGECILCS